MVIKNDLSRQWLKLALCRLPTSSMTAYACDMNRDSAIQMLSQVKPELARRFGVVRLAMFGSMVRNQARDDSDVDIVVGFDGPATSARYFGVQFLLEDLLGRSIDLVSEKAIRPELRAHIERELIDV
jgi:uncharacterized protein